MWQGYTSGAHDKVTIWTTHHPTRKMCTSTICCGRHITIPKRLHADATRTVQVVKLIAYVVVGRAYEAWLAQRLLSVVDAGITGAGFIFSRKWCREKSLPVVSVGVSHLHIYFLHAAADQGLGVSQRSGIAEERQQLRLENWEDTKAKSRVPRRTRTKTSRRGQT